MLRLAGLAFATLLWVTCSHAIEIHHADESARLVCYHTNWAVNRSEPMNFDVKDIDPFMCTHIIYSFAKVAKQADNTYNLEPYEWHDTHDNMYYRQFTDLKKLNPDLHTILAVGGWAHASDGFTEMVETEASRKAFIDHSVEYLRSWGFDGLDLDWEYPCQRGGKPGDRQGYVDLVKELRQAYQAEADETGNPRMTISMAVPAGEYNIDLGYDVPGLSRQLDFINLMAYDLHGQWEGELGHHTALYPGPGDSGGDKKLTVSYAADKWVAEGCPPNKLIVGLGLYGRTWTLGASCDINQWASGGGPAGEFTGERGFWSYYEICDKQKSDMTTTFDNDRRVPYSCSTTRKEWVGFDNDKSLEEKAHFIYANGLGGGMVWALDLDDYNGQFCGQGPWPLMTKIKKLIRESGYVPPTPAPTTPTMYPPTTLPPYTGVPDKFCEGKADGLYPHAMCSATYYNCFNQVTYVMTCGGDLVFNLSSEVCDWPANVPGCPLP